ncbi:MAG: response regulator transcription factor [Nitrospirae bacterium]|nr:response regulator transcription factor [Nitrospirota bacterium]
MKILIVEDEKDLANILKKGFEEHSFVADISNDGEEGLYMAETYSYDAIILDIMLPGIDGIEILSQLRKKHIDVPVLMLTAKGEVKDRIAGLEKGADDYIPKPFDFQELVARVKSAIRRNTGKPSPLIVISNLVVDTNTHTAQRGGTDIPLSAKEYSILEYLASHKNRVISRTELIEHVYETDFDLDSNVIDVYINFLRNKIDKGFKNKLIHTVRGAGYILKETE